MTMQTTAMTMSCDHCGGTIHMHLDTDGRGDRVTYSCDGCGCQWDWGLVLTHKGPRCPVHGTEEHLRQVALVMKSAVTLLTWAKAELERTAGEPTHDDEISF